MAVLDAVDLDYENFYYTEKGYYTADLKGPGTYTKKKYDEKVEALSEAIKAEMEVQSLYEIQFTIEGWYKAS